MSRWIEVEPLMENFGKLTVELWLDSVEEAEIVSLIGNAPSIDLVLCEECIHFTKLSDGWGRCNAHDRIAQTIDFCSWAERKESE